MKPEVCGSVDLQGLSGQFVGVVPPMAFATLSYPKQLLLMFDALALDLSAFGASMAERRLVKQMAPEMDWLAQQGLLSTLEGLAAEARTVASPQPGISVIGEDLLGPIVGRRVGLLGRVGDMTKKAATALRESAVSLRTQYGIDAVAVPSEPISNIDQKVSRDTVIQITLLEFPLPSDSTPWESVLDFRQDPTAKRQWARLKAWLNKFGNSELRAFEFADQLRDMLNDYMESLEIHRLKSRKGVLNVVISTTAEIAENVVKINWSTIAKKAFNVRSQKLALLEAEKGAPGREIAYVLSARHRFESGLEEGRQTA